ncbi:hypothetical protein GCM10025870_14930 [Agromyces marinus]|uniref:Uncharacterized protein n=1 Tax=Agromyces marinus TaxID=1389020 RepID=A0ABM8H0Z0_9MICO|nr:hypothetical protein GCM10025870_14930 [Agromyces marinus]
MDCAYFDAGRCRSCTLMGRPYPAQLAEKQARAEDLLAPFDVAEWAPPVASGERDYRNKAKMVVGGTVDAPTIGILDADGHGVDLQACGICSPVTAPHSGRSPGSSRCRASRPTTCRAARAS